VIVAFLNQKGGVGKTTLSLHIAGAWATRGKRVLVIDTDPQGSALDWSEQRVREGLPWLFGVLGFAHDILHLEATPISRGVHYVQINGSPPMCSAMLAADFVVVPTQRSPFDRWASGEILRRLQEASVFCPRFAPRFALNRDGARTSVARETGKALTKHGPPVLAARAGRRVVFADAARAGRLVSEASRSELAVREIDTLAAEIERLAR
jgi:chromosome partitioning protein